jgi:hypothetical protein
MTTVVPERAPVPATPVTVEEELRCFAAAHDIELKMRRRGECDDNSSLSFGRRDDGGFVMSVGPDREPAEVLAFARTVIERRETDRKVFAVEAALSAAGEGKPGFAELSALFAHSSLWKLNGAGQFIRVVEEALAAVRQEASA